jgi:hypothetical protein
MIGLVGSSLLLLAACGGGGGSSNDVATLSGDGAAAEGATTTAAVDTQQAWLDFAQCMRDNGVDMQDPTFDANGNLQGGFGPGSGLDPRDEATGTAIDACRELMPARGPGSGGGPAFDPEETQATFNEFTECLRDQGLQVDDIDFGDGPGGGPAGGSVPEGSAAGGGFQGGPPPSNQDGTGPGGPNGEGFDPTRGIIERLGLDAADPTVTAAVDACRSIIGNATPGGSTTTTTAG